MITGGLLLKVAEVLIKVRLRLLQISYMFFVVQISEEYSDERDTGHNR
jgi:hypothetical protein